MKQSPSRYNHFDNQTTTGWTPPRAMLARPFKDVMVGEFFFYNNGLWKKISDQGSWNAINAER